MVTAGDGMCVGGSCQRTSGCTAAVAGTRYVDPTAAAGGNGSQGCPYIHVSSAVNDLTGGGTVILKGGTTSTFVGSQAVPAGVNIIGSDGSFAPCTLGTCSNPSAWPKINQTNNAIGFEFETSGARSVSFLQLLGPSALPSPTASGFHISNTATVTLSHVQVSSFKDGIYVATGATATINAGLVATGNTYAGLYVDSGGIADVEAVTGDATIRFDNNTNTAGSNSFGIYVESNAQLTVNGPPSPAPFLIEAVNNKIGVRFYSALAGSSINRLLVGPNSTDNLYLYAKSNLKVRGSQFINSTTGNGVHIVANGTNIATGLRLIDFGTSYTSDPGNNTFSGNGLTGFCIDAAPAVAATNDSLTAQGNNWGGGVTCGATNPGMVKDSASCTAGQDVSDDCTGAITAGHCSATKCAP